jgi:hypothetical protein
MSYESENGLNDLDVAEPLDGATPAELLLAFRQLKAVVKNALLVAHHPDGRLRPGAFTKLEENLVGTGQLVDLAVTSTKLGLGAVTSTKIADLAVTASKLATDSVTEDKYADESIPAAAYKTNTIPLTALASYITRGYLSSHVSDDNIRAVTAQAIADKAVVDRTIDTMTFSKLIGGSNNSLLFKANDAWQAVSLADGALAYNSTTNMFEITNGWKTCTTVSAQTKGLGGGQGASGGWVTRVMTQVTDTDDIFAGTDGTAFKLIPGVYLVRIDCPAFNVGTNQAKLIKRDPTIFPAVYTDVAFGSSVVAGRATTGTPTPASSMSTINTILTVVSGTDEYTLQHWIQTSTNMHDFGYPTDSTNSTGEVYVQGQFIKIA